MIEDHEEDDDAAKTMKRNARIECRAFARLAETVDGKLFLKCLKRDTGWDMPSPPPPYTDQDLNRWAGQRSVIFGILDKISLGLKLRAHPKYQDDE
ncbi:MAG: hypothetical protein JWO82_3758 [Akkermansiaceae bacterium]|nr:hypothetical protein [Akkermansiaceae bacterium]